jgi:hypothetical protein
MPLLFWKFYFLIPNQIMFATDDVFVGAIGQSPLRDVSHSFFYLV